MNPEVTDPNLDIDDTTFLGFNKFQSARDLLPVYKKKLEILHTIEKNDTSIVIGEAGSGKSTQIPQFLAFAGYCEESKCIAITLPRRVGVVSVANRVADEQNVGIGREVGYSVRGDSKFCDQTMIKFMTDGSLLREMCQDPQLRKYSVVILDDVHERSLNTDLIMGLLKKIKKRRIGNMKQVVMSATLEAEKIRNFFEDENQTCKIIHVGGRVFPVNIYYQNAPIKNYVTYAAELCKELHLKKPRENNILVFLTGKEEIVAFIKILIELMDYNKNLRGTYQCLPLYAGLPIERQMMVFNNSNNSPRKIIVSTNIAESSVTIPNIAYVVDSCYVKVKYYDYYKNIDSQALIPASKANMTQRAGRAGRIKPGECYRLCTETDFETQFEMSAPEICRVNLGPSILFLKSLGIANIRNFQFQTNPLEDNLVKSFEFLYSQNLIDLDCNLTDVGGKAVEQPIDPRLAVVLINSFKPEFECTEKILNIVACMATTQGILQPNKDGKILIKSLKKISAKEGDMLTYNNLFVIFTECMQNLGERKKVCNDFHMVEKSLLSAIKMKDQLKQTLKKLGLDVSKQDGDDDDTEALIRCICTGFFANAAQRMPDGTYSIVSTKENVLLHPQSQLNLCHPDWVIFNEVVRSGFSNKIFIKDVCEIDYKWLLELGSNYYEDTKVTELEKRHAYEIEEIEIKVEKKLKSEDQKLPENNNLGAKQKNPFLSLNKNFKANLKDDDATKEDIKGKKKKKVLISDMDFSD